jgi:DNA modification methylase
MDEDSPELIYETEESWCSKNAGKESGTRLTPEPRRIRDRIRELRRVPATALLENPKNWRRHPKAQAVALRDLLTEIGYADALLARQLPNGQLILIDGHLRKETTPDAQVPVLVLDVSEEEADILLATIDPLAAMAESDASRIKALVATLQTESSAVQELLKRTVGDRAWEMLHPDELNQVEISPGRADELRKKWGTEEKQLWQAGANRLVCGDCTDQNIVRRLWAQGGPRIRLLWTDPPYGVSYGDKTRWAHEHGKGTRRPFIENDSLEPDELQRLFSSALAIGKEYAIPGAALYATAPSVFLKYFIQGLEDSGFSYRGCLVWVKQTFVLGRGDYHYRHEPILYAWLENGPHYFGGDRTHNSVFEIDRPTISGLHPTTKPLELIAKMIANSSRPGELVYDPFAGSGSTIIAAHQLGRIGYGCELDPAYLAVQLERLSMLGLEPKLILQ